MKSKNNSIILYLINPLAGAIKAFVDIRNNHSYKTIYLWFLTFGAAFCAYNAAADSFRYVEDFMIDSKMSFASYWTSIQEYFSFDSQVKDIYTLSANFWVGQFTDNYHWLFLLYAAVFGYFYVGSLKCFVANNTVKNNVVFYALLFFFCFSNPIFNINGVRFWTAAWILVYAIFKIYLEEKPIYLLLVLITPLVHASYSLMIPLVLVMLSWKFQTVWIAVFVASSFVSAISVGGSIDYLLDYFPPVIRMMFISYSDNNERLQSLAGVGEPLYAIVLNSLLRYLVLAMSYILIINRKNINAESIKSERLLSIYLIFASFVNVTMPIPSTGTRFIHLAIPLLVIIWAKHYRLLQKYDTFVWVGVLLSSAYPLLKLLRNIDSVTESLLYIFPAPVTFINYLFL